MPVHTGSRIGLTRAEADPQHLHEPLDEGEERTPGAPDLARQLASIPGQLVRSLAIGEEIRNLIALTFGPELWVNADTYVATATTQIGTTASSALLVFLNHTGAAVRLRGVQVGSDGAHVITLEASRSDATSMTSNKPPTRVLAVVRTTTTLLTQPVMPQLTLQPGENLFAVITDAASGKIDFAAEYRSLRGH